MNRLHLISACLMSLLMCGTLYAQWPNDPAQNLVICDRTGEQTIPKIAATYDDGCFVGWYDNSSGNYDLYLQRLDADGNVMWETNGLLVSDHPQESWLTDWDMTVSNGDECVLVLNDIRAGGDWDIYAYRISSEGEFLWGEDGIAISDNDSFEAEPQVLGMADGYCVFAWIDIPAEGSTVRVRKLSPEGVDIFFPPVVSFTSEWGVTTPRMANASGEEIYLQYLVQTGQQIWSPRHIYMQKLSNLGGNVWEEPTIVSSAGGIGPQVKPEILSEQWGGAYSYWYDSRNNDHHVYVQRVDSDGSVGFESNGLLVDGTTNELQMSPTAVTIMDWIAIYYKTANPSQSQTGVQAQYVSRFGERPWGETGMELVPLSTDAIIHIAAVPQWDNATCFYSQDVGAGGTHVRAFSLTWEGELVWGNEPVEISTAQSSKGYLAASGGGSAAAVWADDRAGNTDLYAQNVNWYNGTLGPPPSITITSPEDGAILHTNTVELALEVMSFELGDDGVVQVEWNNGEEFYSGTTTELSYMLEFAEEGDWNIVSQLRTEADGQILSSSDIVHVTYGVPMLSITQPENHSWYLTLDSIDVHFETTNLEFDGPDGGRWINVNVDWDEFYIPPAVDFIEFNHFSADSFWLYFDLMDIGDFYIVLSLIGQNGAVVYDIDSLYLSNGHISAEELPGIPHQFALHAAYPNPFNPSTTIEFDVKQSSDVRIIVHDLLGRQVATLLDERFDSGRYRTTWNAKSVPSGVYFIRMQAGGFVDTQKIVLIK